MVCISILPLTLSKIMAVIAIVIVINLSWRSLDRARSFLIYLIKIWMLHRLAKRGNIDEIEIARIEHKCDLIRRSTARRSGRMQEYWSEIMGK